MSPFAIAWLLLLMGWALAMVNEIRVASVFLMASLFVQAWATWSAK